MQLKTIKIYAIYILLSILSLSTSAFALEENTKIANLFKSSQTSGTFVVYDVEKKKFTGYNYARAKTRYSPASTFKIANSLIGLATNSVSSVDDVLPYKGDEKPLVSAWKHDMGLRQAIKISNVPIYQELARRIGLKQMKKGVMNLEYGNQEIGEKIDRFWLDGPLKISALEQIKFLTKLIQNSLPLQKKIQESVRDILMLEQGENWKLYGKTGWQNAPNSGIGWFVGWLEKENKFYVFALNMDINEPLDAKKRVELTKESLKFVGLIQ
ncbi:class D beta-lactamase [Sulfurimonas sp.]|uniref:class D beta-lactamase n=1 Tax=Sulfurimonas sp. TaxID=2022749 RepID=UPI003D0B7B46